MSNLDAWDEAKAERDELTREQARLADEERRKAYEAVSKALSTYRWWGWTNIINSIRIGIQILRQKIRSARDAS